MLPGFPTDSFLAFALAVPFIQGALFSTMNAGTDLARDIQTGFFSRLALTPIRGAALLAGPARRHRRARACCRRSSTSRRVCCSACASRPGLPGSRCSSSTRRSSRSGSARSARSSRCAPAPARRSRRSSRLLFVFLFISSMNTPRNLIAVDWFRVPRIDQPGLVPDRVRPQPDHHGLGRRGARARLRDRDRARDRLARPLAGVGARAEDGADMRLWPVASGVAWRTLKNVLTTPSLLLPSLAFPLFFFVAFAGGLSQVQNTPGLRLPERLHGVPVRLRPAPVGRVRRRLHGLRRRARLRGRLRQAAAARRAEPERDRARLLPRGAPALVRSPRRC